MVRNCSYDVLAYLCALILEPDLYDPDAEAGLGSERLPHLATWLRVDFKRRLELSSLTGRQDRSRSLRSLRLIAVAVIDAAVVVSCINDRGEQGRSP